MSGQSVSTQIKMREYFAKNFRKMMWVIVGCVIYVLLFPILQYYLGSGVTALSIAVVLITGWSFGSIVGVFSAVFAVFINLFLLGVSNIEEFQTIMVEGGFAGTLALILGGFMGGKLSVIQQRLKNNLKKSIEIQEELQEAKFYIEQLFQVVPSAVFTVDKNKLITNVNHTFQNMLGYAEYEIVGKPCSFFALEPCGKNCGLYNDEILKPIEGAECKVRKKTGETLTVIKNVAQIYNHHGKVIGGIESFTDITQRKELEQELEYMSLHDGLTGLYNRSFFQKRLESFKDSKHFPVSLLMIDLDGLKGVNDCYGHLAGDDLLVRTARILQTTFRGQDVIARLGGDEFAVILEQTTPEEAMKIVERLFASLYQDNQRNRQPLNFSVGLSTAWKTTSLFTALEKADKKMYSAKKQRNGKGLTKPVESFNINCRN